MFWTFGKWFLILAIVLGAALGKFCMDLAIRLHWVDRPGHRKGHKRPVPYLGGLALFLSITLTVSILYVAFGLDAQPGNDRLSLVFCLVPALLASLLGLYDDLRDMPARMKFGGQGLIALAFCLFGYRFSVLDIPGFSPIALDPAVAVAVTTFFIMAVVNGFNMTDGSDALCLGISLVSLATLSVMADWTGQPHLMALALSGCGAALGLLYWNRPPARIYGGDAGSQGLGFLVACLLVALGAGAPGHFFSDRPIAIDREPFPFQIVICCFVVGVPALEVALTVMRRGLQGRPLGRADRGHLHHRLERIGLRPLGVALTAAAGNLLGSLIAVAFLVGDNGMAVLLMMLVVATLSLGLQKLGFMRIFHRSWLDDRRPHFAVANHYASMQLAKLKLSTSREEVLALVAQVCHEFGIHELRVSLRDDNYSHKLWTWSWVDPLPPIVPERLRNRPNVSDRVRLPGTRNHASWSMGNDDREAELSMNIRILLVDIMNRALERLVELRPTFVENRERYSFGISGQRDLVLSVKGYKSRLQARQPR